MTNYSSNISEETLKESVEKMFVRYWCFFNFLIDYFRLRKELKTYMKKSSEAS